MQNWVLYGIMLTLLTKKKASRQYLAEKFEISERTVSRYIDTLAESGVPIYSIAGREGGYSISDEYKLDNTLFSPEELSRIITCVKAIPEDKINKSVIDKLEHLSLRKNKNQFLVNNDKLVIDAASWSNPEIFRHKMDVLNEALEKGVSVSMKYIDRHQLSSVRVFDPYSVVLKGGVWYTYGWCHKHENFRLFKLSRITSIIITDEVFERRESNVYEKLSGNFSDIPLIDLEIEFSSTILGDIEEWLGLESISERGLKYIAKAQVYSGNLLIKRLLSFGSSIKVLHPAAVREELLVECRRILRDSGNE